jgi:phosphate transport system protein
MVAAVEVCLDSGQRVFALISAMAGMVETAVDQAIQGLLTGDIRLTETLLQRESVVNHLEMHIDAAILAQLAHEKPRREDARYMASMLKINKDLERIGDLAANIGRRLIELGDSRAANERSDLQPMSIAVSHICRKTLRALVRQDVVLAESAVGSEETMRAYRDYVFRKICERLISGSRRTNSDVALLLASRYLEEIASHAINLAHSLVFWLRGTPDEERAA